MVRVAKCESGYDQYDASSSDGVLHGAKHYADMGLFQINSGVHGTKPEGIDISTLEGNIAYAKLLHQWNGYSDWAPSKGCWGK